MADWGVHLIYPVWVHDNFLTKRPIILVILYRYKSLTNKVILINNSLLINISNTTLLHSSLTYPHKLYEVKFVSHKTLIA